MPGLRSEATVFQRAHPGRHVRARAIDESPMGVTMAGGRR